MSKKIAVKSEFLGERIKKLRREREWSRQELAQKIGTHLQTINRYEYGATLPAADALQKLAGVFGVSIDYLVLGDTDSTALRVHNKELFKRFEQLDRVNPDDIKDLLSVMDVYIQNKAAKELLSAQ